MIIIFQGLFIIFSIFAVFSIIKKKSDQKLGPKGSTFWILFWILADIAVLWPNSTTVIANSFGIGRGADFILYISIALIFFLLFRLHIKIESLSRDVTEVVRKNALEKIDTDKEE